MDALQWTPKFLFIYKVAKNIYKSVIHLYHWFHLLRIQRNLILSFKNSPKWVVRLSTLLTPVYKIGNNSGYINRVLQTWPCWKGHWIRFPTNLISSKSDVVWYLKSVCKVRPRFLPNIPLLNFKFLNPFHAQFGSMHPSNGSNWHNLDTRFTIQPCMLDILPIQAPIKVILGALESSRGPLLTSSVLWCNWSKNLANKFRLAPSSSMESSVLPRKKILNAWEMESSWLLQLSSWCPYHLYMNEHQANW